MPELRLHLTRPTGAQSYGDCDNIRVIEASDVDDLAELMVDAYAGTVDYAGETVEKAREEIGATLDGAYGPLIGAATLGLWEQQKLQSAVVVTLFRDTPLFAFCMTAKSAKRKGYCFQLMKVSLDRLEKLGYSQSHLYVTKSNKPAVALYRQLGFEEMDDNVGDTIQA